MSRKNRLTKAVVKQFLQDPSEIDLNSYVAIDDAAAAALADYAGKCLTLNGLVLLSADAADSLAGYSGYRIELNGLEALDEKAAKLLAQYSGALIELNGLASISDATAKELAAFAGRLDLDGLATLSDSVAASLAQHKGPYLSLNGITVLSSKAADALSRHRGQHVSLRGLAPSQGVVLGDALPLSTESRSEPSSTDILTQTKAPRRIPGFIYAPDEETYEAFMQDGGLSSMRFVEAGAAVLPEELRCIGLQVHRPKEASQFVEVLAQTPYSYLCYADVDGNPVDVVVCQRVLLDDVPAQIETLRRFLAKHRIEFYDCGESILSCIWGSQEF
ncbi:MAG: hypothetical protein ACKOYJ_00980 [Planctomycetia bacterium]